MTPNHGGMAQAAPDPHKAPGPEPEGWILYPGDKGGSGDRANHDRHPAEPHARCRRGIRGVEDRNGPRMSPVRPLAQSRDGLRWKGLWRIPEPLAAHPWEILMWGCLAVARDGAQTPCPHGAGHLSRTPMTPLQLMTSLRSQASWWDPSDLLQPHTSLWSWVSRLVPSTSSPCTSQASQGPSACHPCHKMSPRRVSAAAVPPLPGFWENLPFSLCPGAPNFAPRKVTNPWLWVMAGAAALRVSLPEPPVPSATPLVGTPGCPCATTPNWGQAWAGPYQGHPRVGTEQDLGGDSGCSGSSWWPVTWSGWPCPSWEGMAVGDRQVLVLG